LLHLAGHVSFVVVHPQSEGDVAEDAHGKGVRLLEHHTDVTANCHWIDSGSVNILAVEVDVSSEAEAAHQVIHAIQAA
jgi:hypothetical protein